MCRLIWKAKIVDVSESNSTRIMRIAFMSDTLAKPFQSGFPKIYDVFDDHLEIWTGYPLTRDVTPYRPTLYLRERCRLAEIFKEVHVLILTKAEESDATVQGFTSAVKGVLAEIMHWHERLPLELQYRWPMCISIWELRSVQSHSSLMPLLRC